MTTRALGSRVHCRCCGRTYAPTTAGLVRAHRPTGSPTQLGRCPGSGQPPRGVRSTTDSEETP